MQACTLPSIQVLAETAECSEVAEEEAAGKEEAVAEAVHPTRG